MNPALHILSTKRPASEEEMAYIAGLLDGEGCIAIARSKRNGEWKIAGASVKIGMTDRLGVQLVRDIFGGSMTLRKRTGAMACYKPMWTWCVLGRKAAYVVDCVLPYLRVKLPQANLLLQFQRTIPIRGTQGHRGKIGGAYLSHQAWTERQWFFDRMKRLNRRAKEITCN